MGLNIISLPMSQVISMRKELGIEVIENFKKEASELDINIDLIKLALERVDIIYPNDYLIARKTYLEDNDGKPFYKINLTQQSEDDGRFVCIA